MDARHEERVPLVPLQSATSDKYGAANGVNPSHDSVALQVADGPASTAQFDYVLVFPTDLPENASITKQDILNRLQLAGLITEEVASQSATFCKIRADIPRLQKEAARVKLPILLDEAKLEEIAKTGLRAFHIDSFEVENPPRQWIDMFKRPVYAPYQSIYMPYAKEVDQSLYASHDGSFFSSIHRMQLIESILTNVNGGGAGLDIEKLMSDGIILACYPLHNVPQKEALQKVWMAWCYAPWQQPLHGIRNYFGPKLAIYFAFLGHYTTYLLWASLAGVLVTIVQLAPSKVSLYVESSALTYILPFFGMGMLLWATFLLKHWKRRNSVLAMEWGMSDFDKHSNDVKLFHNSPNTWWEKVYRLGGSWLVVAALLSLGIFAMSVLARIYESPSSPAFLRGNNDLLAVAIIVQIVVLSFLAQWVCVKLNFFENHPTESSYELSFISKLVVLEMVNHFGVLSYFSFFVAMDPLEFSWLVYRVYAAYIVIDHVQMFFLRPRQPPMESQSSLQRDMEAQFHLHEYTWKHLMIDHFKLALHFTYVTLFAVLCPLNPILSFVHYSLELRFNGSKLLHAYRRPRPQGAETLGPWYTVLHWILNGAILSNAWLMVVINPTQTLKDMPDTIPTTSAPFNIVSSASSHQVVLTLIFAIVVCRVLITVAYQDTPSRIRLQLDRQVYYVSKLYYKAFGWPEHANLSKSKAHSAFEYCLAFPNPEGLAGDVDKNAMATVLDTLKKANIHYKVYPSSTKASTYLSSYIFCEVRPTEAQLQQEAARIQLPMLLDEIMLREKAHEGVFQALYTGMVDVVDRLRVEAIRVNLMLLIENIMTQSNAFKDEHIRQDVTSKLERLLATLDNREPRRSVSFNEVLSDFKEVLEVDIEGEQYRAMHTPQTLLNRIEIYLNTGATTPSKSTHSKKHIAFEHSSSKVFDRLVEETVKALHEQSLNTLYMAQREWNIGLDRVLWDLEDILRGSFVSPRELQHPNGSDKVKSMQDYLSSFNTDKLYPKLSEMLDECMTLLNVRGSSPYHAFQEFRAKNPTSPVLDLIAALEASIIANPDVDIYPFYLGNPDANYNLLAKRFKYRPYQYLHMPYYRQLGKWQEVYATPSPHSSFTPMQRMTVIESLLNRHINLDSLVAQRVLSAAFPLHDKVEHEELGKRWISWSLSQPLDQVYAYFGPNVAFYFAHLGHSTKWLSFATAASVLFFVWQTLYSFGTLELYVVPAFGMLLIVWATLWLKHWTRARNVLKMKWGINETKTRSPVRAAYIGDFVRNPVTGHKVKYFRKNARLIRWALGWLIFGVFLGFALGLQALVFYIAMQHATTQYVPVGTAFVQACLILVTKYLYNRWSVLLIDYENHRTEASHEAAYIIKAGVFHALNSFGALIFLLADPSLRNRNSLYIIYGVELVASHAASVVHLVLQSNGSTAEEQFFQEEYSWVKSFERHFDRVIHFGYMIGGVVVCPLAPAFAFLDHVLAIRLQATRLLNSTRRPRVRHEAYTWYISMMNIVVIAAMISNSYLVIYVVKSFGPASILATFDGFSCVLFALIIFRLLLNSIFNDVPTKVYSQLERQQFVVDSILQEQPINVVVPAVAQAVEEVEDVQDEVDDNAEVEEEGFV